MKRITILTCCFILVSSQFLSAADVVPEQITRSEEMLSQEQALRGKIAEEKAVFIEKIIVSGADPLPLEEIEKIVTPFQKRWLNKGDIDTVVNLLTQAYEERLRLEEKGYKKLEASYKVKGETLLINFAIPQR